MSAAKAKKTDSKNDAIHETIIHGAFTLLAPLHSGMGHKGLRLNAAGQISSGATGIPVVSTVTQPLTVDGAFWGFMPIYPSTSIIGALRRHAARRVIASLTADGAKLSSSVFYALMHGQTSALQLAGIAKLELHQAVQSDLFFGLFGGANMRSSAAFSVSDLVPIAEVTLSASTVPQRFSDLAGAQASKPTDFLSVRVIRRSDDLLKDGAAQLLHSVDLETIQDDEKTKDGAAAYEVIPPGTSMYFKLRMAGRTSPEQAGLLVLALKDFVQSAQMGAREHLGWGRFTAQRMRLIERTVAGDVRRKDLFDVQEDEDGFQSVMPTQSMIEYVRKAEVELEKNAQEPAEARKRLESVLRNG